MSHPPLDRRAIISPSASMSRLRTGPECRRAGAAPKWPGKGALRRVWAIMHTMKVSPRFSARYAAATARCGGWCPIEAGVLGRLADHECKHGRLRFDRTPACGCWPGEEGVLLALPLSNGGLEERAA